MISDWNALMTLTNPYTLGTALAGPLLLNHQYDPDVDGLGIYKVVARQSEVIVPVRATKQNMPQANGSRLPRRFLAGVEIKLVVQMWETEEDIACDVLLRKMSDTLKGAVRSILNAGDNVGRLAWVVEEANDRMLDDCRMLGYPDLSQQGVGIISFTLDSVFPYGQDLVQQQTGLPADTPVTISNVGTADYSPVFKINQLDGVVGGGDVSVFDIINNTTGLQFSYDASQPGGLTIAGGQYAELDCFRNTIYLNGDSSNLKAGVVQLSSEYFDLAVGDNEIVIEGCDADILWAPAWA